MTDTRLNLYKWLLIILAVPPAVVSFMWCVPLFLMLCGQGRVYQYQPPANLHISPGQKLQPAFWLGNIDDPQPPTDYLPDDPERVNKWYFRNPFHNLTFYVIGIADRPFERVGLVPDRVFNPDSGFNWAVCRTGLVVLPFLSFENKNLSVYAGWRDRGNFGLKFNLHH